MKIRMDQVAERLGKEGYNKQNELMKIIEYRRSDDIIVEFQDEFKAKVHTKYYHFQDGAVSNPFYKSVYGMGMLGNTYSARGQERLEYKAWNHILERCFSETYKKKQPTYKEVTCCKEWLLFDNFYKWIHSQENFQQWYHGERWGLDKDILHKGNKIYSPENCCLVPQRVNNLFTKNNIIRGKTAIGVYEDGDKYLALCNNPFTKEQEYFGSFNTEIEAFKVYKKVKEKFIKQVAEEEYALGNITKRCYDAMMNYEVEITD